MAQPARSGSIFNEKAAEKLRSPDDLEKYVRVTNPSVWAILGACVALVVGLLAWGVFGAVSTRVGATGVNVNGVVMCFLDAEQAAKVHVGDEAMVAGERMEVASVSVVPLSREEAHEVLGSDYLASVLVEDDWAYLVTFDGDGDYPFDEGVPLTASITVERVAPLELVFG